MVSTAQAARIGSTGSLSRPHSTRPPHCGRRWLVVPALLVVAAAVAGLGVGLTAGHSASPHAIATGCQATESELRALFRAHPDAMAIGPSAAATLRADLQRLDQACPAPEAQGFRATNLEPWLNGQGTGR